ncbi:unnamed protein product, partial [Iphiclides podalirius]
MDKSIKKKNSTNGKYKKNCKTDAYDEEVTCCFCVKTKKGKKKSLITGCITNLGIFTILLIYTLLGAFIFLAIEGSAAKVHQKTLAATSYQGNENQKTIPLSKVNSSIAHASAELRTQTVESIWEITVSLNILYKENWTRLAAQEIARFQEKLVARVAADVTEQYGGVRALESAPALITDDYEWNFAKAFLYSLTVLTTIGYGSVAPRTALGKAVTIAYAVIGTVWFCSIYIMTGLALTAMCFNVLHDEIVHRLRHNEKLLKLRDNRNKYTLPKNEEVHKWHEEC